MLATAPAPRLLEVVPKDAWVPEPLRDRLRAWSPQSELGKIARACFGYLPAELAAELLDRISASLIVESALSITVIRRVGDPEDPFPLYQLEDLGVVSRKLVTTAGVNYLSGAFQANGNLSANFKYHGIGTGNTAEAITDTALVTEVETRATGTQVAGAGANIYRTVGTVAITATRAIVEHGVFSAASVGTLWDRSVFTVINLLNLDSLQITYDLTLTAGG